MHAVVELHKYEKASEQGFLNTAFLILKDQQNGKKKIFSNRSLEKTCSSPDWHYVWYILALN